MREELKKLKNFQPIINRVNNGESFVNVSKEYNVGTYKLARVYLESSLRAEEYDSMDKTPFVSKNNANYGHQRTNPKSNQRQKQSASSGVNNPVNLFLENPSIVKDERIRLELLKMIEIDPISSHEIGIR